MIASAVVICIIVLIAEDRNLLASAESSFLVSFQESGDWTTNEWGKYIDEIRESEEFTACHWQKIRFYSSDIVPLWSLRRNN